MPCHGLLVHGGNVGPHSETEAVIHEVLAVLGGVIVQRGVWDVASVTIATWCYVTVHWSLASRVVRAKGDAPGVVVLVLVLVD